MAVFRVLDNTVVDFLRQRPDSSVTKAARAGYRLANRWFGKKDYVDKDVSLSTLLCGGEDILSAFQYARHTDDYLRPSRPLSQSPHVQFLEQYCDLGPEIFKPEIFNQTSYYANAARCINTLGRYFNCTSPRQIEHIARAFVKQFETERNQNEACHARFSAPNAPVVVKPIVDSPCYEIMDGHHRLAIAYVKGKPTFPVRVLLASPVITPLQQLLIDHAWTQGRRELYQPIDSPELRTWPLVRRCTDRMSLYKSFLAYEKLSLPPKSTYLDVGCSFGWFVRQFQDMGFDAYGVEMDWAACEIAKLVYGLGPDRIKRAEIVDFLDKDRTSFDVVSCFSVMHHFVMGRASITAEELLSALDAKTKHVLFFEMGQSHEEWFQSVMPGWNPDSIEDWLKCKSSFKKIYRLGIDSDAVPPYERNYGRTQFALVR